MVYLNSVGWTSYTNGETGSRVVGWMSSNGKFVYGVHKEKHRKIVEQTKVKGKNAHKVISNGYWLITIYKFPIERVKELRQHPRHFDVVLF